MPTIELVQYELVVRYASTAARWPVDVPARILRTSDVRAHSILNESIESARVFFVYDIYIITG